MKDVIVITSCTGRLGLIDAYEQRLADAGIDHCFETIPVATSSFDMRARIDYWRGLANRFLDYRAMIVTDAWDVMFVGAKEELLLKLKRQMAGVLISAERNCFPGPEFGEEDLSAKIVGRTPWKYANPGMMIANPEVLLRWLTEAEEHLPLDISDQAWFNRRLVDNRTFIALDVDTFFFYVISYNDGRLEDGSLQIKDGRLWNSTCGTYPNFIHFAGHGPHEARRVIPGQAPPRYMAQDVIRRYLELGQ